MRSVKLYILLVLIICFANLGYAFDMNYSTYDNLLRKYVSADGNVDYLAWKQKDLGHFERYIQRLESISLKGANANEKKAFWINAYNALTIYAVLKRIPNSKLLTKVFSVQIIPGFFDKIKYEVAGEALTLNDIEDEKLREAFNDASIHFAIVCASRSCPKIVNRIYGPLSIDKRLDDATRIFIQDETKNRLDKENNVLHLSQIFKWYEDDFLQDSGSLLAYFRKYANKKDIWHLFNKDVAIRYVYYDWLVNIKQEEQEKGGSWIEKIRKFKDNLGKRFENLKGIRK